MQLSEHKPSQAVKSQLPWGRPALTLAARSSGLCLVTTAEEDNLRACLGRGHLPPDFDSKLRRLESGDLLERAVARQCRVFIELFFAAHNGSYKQAGSQECDQLIRVLAYVRKDDDARPDYKPQGFTDDQLEVQAVEASLRSLLQHFKGWRLQHQVPGMWMN